LLSCPVGSGWSALGCTVHSRARRRGPARGAAQRTRQSAPRGVRCGRCSARPSTQSTHIKPTQTLGDAARRKQVATQSDRCVRRCRARKRGACLLARCGGPQGGLPRLCSAPPPLVHAHDAVRSLVKSAHVQLGVLPPIDVFAHRSRCVCLNLLRIARARPRRPSTLAVFAASDAAAKALAEQACEAVAASATFAAVGAARARSSSGVRGRSASHRHAPRRLRRWRRW
jgi:hypothetical protein